MSGLRRLRFAWAPPRLRFEKSEKKRLRPAGRFDAQKKTPKLVRWGLASFGLLRNLNADRATDRPAGRWGIRDFGPKMGRNLSRMLIRALPLPLKGGPRYLALAR